MYTPETEVVQFVGYSGQLPQTTFLEQWQAFAGQYAKKSLCVILQQQVQTRSRFNYVSTQNWPENDFLFNFMGNRNSAYFPERNMRVIQIGGYIKTKPGMPHKTGGYRVFAFLKQEETDYGYYRETGADIQFNEYAAFYESCIYGHIFEYFTTQQGLPALLLLLAGKTGCETAVYQTCNTPARRMARATGSK